MCAALGVALLTAAPLVAGAFSAAQAQTRVSAEFRTALEPYGRWERHARWGEVWIPANRTRGWRPYTVGRWVYTNDWGWYWAEDQAEAAWGWATYHYGRWALDPELGWVWIPGDEWGPAYVEWRSCSNRARDLILWPPRRDCLIGWAPLPPDNIVAEFVEEPAFWTFVHLGDFATAPRMSAVILPFGESATFLRETVLINRTVPVREHGHFAVNPGIPAGVVAAAIGRPLHTFAVRPRVLAGTANIPGASVINPQELRNAGRNRNAISQPHVQQTANVIAPATRAPQIKPLAAGEHGRLGAYPPRAATGALQQPRQQGQTQQQQQPQRQQERAQQQQPQLQPQQPGRQQPSRPATEGRAVTPQQPPNRPQPPAAREAPQTQGRAIEERRHEVAPQRRQPQQTERSRVEVPRGRMEQPRARTQPQRTVPSATEGRGGGAPPPHIAPPAPHAAPVAPPAAPHAAPAPAAPAARAAPAGGGPHRP